MDWCFTWKNVRKDFLGGESIKPKSYHSSAGMMFGDYSLGSAVTILMSFKRSHGVLRRLFLLRAS
jgi:hypothetical protein